MEDKISTLIGVGIYCSIMVIIAIFLQKRNKSAEDFLVAGRSFGTFFTTGTLCACMFGGSIFFGVPGAFYTFGIWDSDAKYGLLVMSAGVVILYTLCALFFFKPLWKLKLLSLGDLYYRRYGKAVGATSTIIISLCFTLWVAVQMAAFAKVGTIYLDLSYSSCIIIAAVTICTYTILGGLWAICFTDIVQIIIVTGSIIIFAPMIVEMAGGWDYFAANFPTEKLNALPKSGSGMEGLLAWIAGLVVIGVGSIPSPDLAQRAFAAKNPRVIQKSAFIASAIYILGTSLIIIITVGCLQLLQTKGIDMSFLDEDAELLLPTAFQYFMPKPLMILFLGAILAALMSAAATANIALSAAISKNIVCDIFKPDMSSRSLMQATRVTILFVGLLAAVMAVKLPSIFFLTNLGFDLLLSCLFMPMALGIYWAKANSYGACAGILAGAGVRIISSGIINGFSLEGIGSPTEYWYVFSLFGPLCSLTAMVLISLLTQKSNPPLKLVYQEG